MSSPFISRIEIENFRNLHALRANFPQNVVIVGENRSGKSNLLYALRLVLDPALPDAARDLRAEDFWDGLPAPFAGSTISVKLWLDGFAGDASAEAVLADCIVQGEPLKAALTYVYRPRPSTADPLTAGEADYEFLVYGGDDESRVVGRDVRRWIAVAVLPAMRDAEGQLSGSRRTLLHPLIERVRPSVPASTLVQVRDDLEGAAARLVQEPAVRGLQDAINIGLRSVLGKHQPVETQLGFAPSDPDKLLANLRLFLQDGKSRNVGDASLGTANLLYLSLLLQDLDERRSSGDAAGLVLAIEEPEAHLHPHMQRLLFRYALRRDHSVLVTTHSPHIASVAPLGSIMVMRSSGTGTDRTSRLCTVTGASLSADETADLERYMDVNRAELLFARGVIFVEGMAEQFLVPAFAGFEIQRRGLGGSLDEMGITVCAVAGTDFRPYWRVTSATGWDIPRVVLTDGDPREVAATGPSRTVYAGLVRGARLLARDDLKKAALDGEADYVRDALSADGIFVNTETLEAELARVMRPEMIETFEELVPSSAARTRFSLAMNGTTGVDVGALIGVIDDYLGKGRFAQRLASKVTQDHELPEYLDVALDHIFELVSHA